MPRRSQVAQVYAVTANLVLGITRDYLEVTPEVDIEDLLILLGAFVGYFEERPLTPAKIALYVGLPRQTVTRRVKRLVQKHLLEWAPDMKSVVTPRHRLVGELPQKLACKYVRHIRNAAEKLPKMST